MIIFVKCRCWVHRHCCFPHFSICFQCFLFFFLRNESLLHFLPSPWVSEALMSSHSWKAVTANLDQRTGRETGSQQEVEQILGPRDSHGERRGFPVETVSKDQEEDPSGKPQKLRTKDDIPWELHLLLFYCSASQRSRDNPSYHSGANFTGKAFFLHWQNLSVPQKRNLKVSFSLCESLIIPW